MARIPIPTTPPNCWTLQQVAGAINAMTAEIYQELAGVTAGGGTYAYMNFDGVLQDETEFGYFVMPANAQILGTLMTVQEVAVGNNITIDYVDGNGVEQGAISTLNQNAEIQATIFVSPLVVSQGATIRAKTKSIGSVSTEGAYLTAIAIIRYV